MGQDQNMYRILEDIKDGAATTSKYDNQVIKFKTPNHVMIFSNSMPDRNHLSNDRWQIFKPCDGELEMVESVPPRPNGLVSELDDSYKKGKFYL